ncbi:hypothetical protein [uncultured Mitsuokella sp.]|uniref:hypothetical protein n=1 Tax=uncultured Mitsuokella sp. TaxID=453120 RepID=UPI00259468DB|nr:hypothetical protein [uncultured Mitsuokella sp.]
MVAKAYSIKRLRTEEEKQAAAEELYENLRDVDSREISAWTWDVAREVRESIFMSDEAWAAREKRSGALIAVWGKREIQGKPGRLIWCLGTEKVKRHFLPFALESRVILKRWARKYRRLYNAVGAFNEDALKWLAWCGAEFLEPFELEGEKFYPFEIKGD